MKRIYRMFRNAAACVGFILLFGGAGASDFYTLEMKQPEPDSVNKLILWGFILMIPIALHLLREWLKEVLRERVK